MWSEVCTKSSSEYLSNSWLRLKPYFIKFRNFIYFQLLNFCRLVFVNNVFTSLIVSYSAGFASTTSSFTSTNSKNKYFNVLVQKIKDLLNNIKSYFFFEKFLSRLLKILSFIILIVKYRSGCFCLLLIYSEIMKCKSKKFFYSLIKFLNLLKKIKHWQIRFLHFKYLLFSKNFYACVSV